MAACGATALPLSAVPPGLPLVRARRRDLGLPRASANMCQTGRLSRSFDDRGSKIGKTPRKVAWRTSRRAEEGRLLALRPHFPGQFCPDHQKTGRADRSWRGLRVLRLRPMRAPRRDVRPVCHEEVGRCGSIGRSTEHCYAGPSIAPGMSSPCSRSGTRRTGDRGLLSRRVVPGRAARSPWLLVAPPMLPPVMPIMWRHGRRRGPPDTPPRPPTSSGMPRTPSPTPAPPPAPPAGGCGQGCRRRQGTRMAIRAPPAAPAAGGVPRPKAMIENLDGRME